MNILNVCSNFDPVTGGGEAERTFQMSKYLLVEGVNCRILTVDNGLNEQRKIALGDAMVIVLPCLLRRFYVPRVSLRYIQQLVDEADVVHLIGHWTLLNALVYWAIKRARKPYVVCPAGALPIFGRSKIIKKIYNLIIGSKIVRDANMCISITDQEVDCFISSGVPPEKVLVIPNGIADADFTSCQVDNFRKKYSLGVRPFILFVGRLNLIKGPDLLLRAFCNVINRIDNVDLVFVGPDGGLLQELESLARATGLENRVHFIGYLGGADKSDAYHAAELLVIPSRHEAMSIVALEAGICGTPVLLTDQCGFDQLQETGGGWVIPASVEGLEKGLVEILLRPELIKLAGVNIKSYVAENFSWNTIVQAYMGMYVQLIAVSNGMSFAQTSTVDQRAGA
jgi:glycosyltransferase involved in cell wall biosynthesis